MNNTCKLMIALFVATLAGSSTNAQIVPLKPRDEVIDPYRLYITFYKTTNLVFPYAIRSVDRGSADILAQKAKNTENVLQVKADRQGFDETNLTVITADGKLYSYVLNYKDTPSVLNISFDRGGWNARAFFSEQNINEAEVQETAKKVAASDNTVRRLKDKGYGMYFSLDAIYISGEVMYLRFAISNQSNVDYDISQFRMKIIDQKKTKRTAMQEIEISPLYIYNDIAIIKGKSQTELVYAVPKFTIPDKKYLAIQLMEKNGGRTMQLAVHNKTVIKARSIN